MPRRKITRPAAPVVAPSVALISDEAANDLPDLTPQQMGFVEGILSGKSAADAYRGAYDCSNMLKTSVSVAACKLKNNPRVALWLREARKAKLGTAALTLDSHVQELERLREIALESGNVGAAVQAEQLRGKAHGIYVERHADVTPPDPTRALLQLARSDPVIGRALAVKFGLELDPAAPRLIEADSATDEGE